MWWGLDSSVQAGLDSTKLDSPNQLRLYQLWLYQLRLYQLWL